MEAKAPIARRSQKDRSEETRQKVIAAATVCIAEFGYQGTNMARIAKKAGVSVGAIQHQFGDKAAVLFAVIENSLTTRAATFVSVPVTGDNTKTRVGEFIHRMWQHGFSSPVYATAIEILIAIRKDPVFANRSGAYFTQLHSVIDRLWMGEFWELDANRAQHSSALQMICDVLNGMAVNRLIGMLDEQMVEASLNHLTDATLALLAISD